MNRLEEKNSVSKKLYRNNFFPKLKLEGKKLTIIDADDSSDEQVLSDAVKNDFDTTIENSDKNAFFPLLQTFIDICLDISEKFSEGAFLEEELNPGVKIDELHVDVLGNALSSKIKYVSPFICNDDTADFFLYLAETGVVLKKLKGKLPRSFSELIKSLRQKSTTVRPLCVNETRCRPEKKVNLVKENLELSAKSELKTRDKFLRSPRYTKSVQRKINNKN